MGESVVLDPAPPSALNLITFPSMESAWYDEEVLASGASMLADDMGGAIALDRTGNGYHGLFVSNPPKATNPGDGTYAVDFDGANDYLNFPGLSPFVNGQTFAFGCFANRDTAATADTLMAGSTATGPALVLTSAGHVTLDPQQGGGAAAVTWTGAAVAAGSDGHYVCVIREATDVAELYVNGVSVGTKAITDAFHATPGNLKVGASGTGATDPFDGKIWKPSVWIADEPSAAEVAAMYAARNVKGPRPFADQVKETFDGQSLANFLTSGTGITESGGALTASAVGTGIKLLAHNVRTVGDAEAVAHFRTPAIAGVAGTHACVNLKGSVNLATYLSGQIRLSDGALRIFMYPAGTQLGSTVTVGVLTANTEYWLRIAIAGNQVAHELWTTEPSPGGAPAFVTTGTLSGADATTYGAGVVGYPGARTDITASSLDLAILTFNYRPLSRPTVRRSTAWAESGSASVKQTATQGASGPPIGLPVGTQSELVALSAGDEVAVAVANEETDGYTAGALTGVAFYDSSQRLIDLDTAAGTAHQTTAPTGTAQAAVFHGGALAAAETIDVSADLFTLAEASEEVLAFDGDSEPTVPTHRIEWTGTPHASTTQLTRLREPLDITPFIREEGPDWDDAQIEQYMAQLSRGEIPVGYRVPNRNPTFPLQALDRTGVTFEQFRERIQAKAALFQREGAGWISRETQVGTLYADIVGATLKMGGGGLQARGQVDQDIQLSLVQTPDWYGAEEQLDVQSETAQPELIFALTGIKGNWPARCRIVVTELDGDDQLGLLWGVRSRNYDAAITAALTYQAEDLDPLDAATTATLTGSSKAPLATDGAVYHADLAAGWTPVVGMKIGGTDDLTHVGTYRVYARVQTPATDPTEVDLRLVWDVGDLTLPAENDPWTFPDHSQFYIADLGEIRLDRVPVGAHRWDGQIQARSGSGAKGVYIDKVWLVPLDEAAGKVRVIGPVVDGLATFTARDEFNQSAGNLNGKTAPVGGVWATSGSATDLAVEATGKSAQKTAVSESYRYAISGAAASASQLVQVDVKASAAVGPDLQQGVVARWTDSSNRFAVTLVTGVTTAQLVVSKIVAGVLTTIKTVDVPWGVDQWFTVRCAVTADGRWYAWVFRQGAAPGDPVAAGRDTVLATGGTLATGKPGFRDYNNAATACTRNYDNFLAYAPSLDAVVFSSRSCELRTEGIHRDDAAGNAGGPVSHATGDLPRLPPSGMEDRTVEVFLKASRGDLDQLPDAGIDDIQAQVFYRPTYLYIPAAA